MRPCWRPRCRPWSARHASLRSGFRHEQLSRPVQVVLARVAVPWRLIDLSGLRCGEQQQRLSDDPRGRPPGAVRSGGAAADAVCADPACGGPAPAADQQPSSSDGRLVGADPGAGAACGLCAARQRGVAAAGDAVPRLSRRSSPGRTARRRWRRGGRRWPVSRRARGLRRATGRTREPVAPEQIVLSLGAGAERFAQSRRRASRR